MFFFLAWTIFFWSEFEPWRDLVNQRKGVICHPAGVNEFRFGFVQILPSTWAIKTVAENKPRQWCSSECEWTRGPQTTSNQERECLHYYHVWKGWLHVCLRVDCLLSYLAVCEDMHRIDYLKVFRRPTGRIRNGKYRKDLKSTKRYCKWM